MLGQTRPHHSLQNGTQKNQNDNKLSLNCAQGAYICRIRVPTLNLPKTTQNAQVAHLTLVTVETQFLRRREYWLYPTNLAAYSNVQSKWHHIHVENLPSWIRHHVWKAWSVFSSFVAQSGTEFCPEIDDPQDVCNRLASMPEKLLDRLEPSFIGLEREVDNDGIFRNWYSALSKRYAHDMKTVKLIYRTDYTKSYTHSALVVQKFIPEFAKFFDSLREFIGIQACLNSCWRQGDTYRAKWDLSVFERHIVWGGIAV